MYYIDFYNEFMEWEKLSQLMREKTIGALFSWHEWVWILVKEKWLPQWRMRYPITNFEIDVLRPLNKKSCNLTDNMHKEMYKRDG